MPMFNLLAHPLVAVNYATNTVQDSQANLLDLLSKTLTPLSSLPVSQLLLTFNYSGRLPPLQSLATGLRSLLGLGLQQQTDANCAADFNLRSAFMTTGHNRPHCFTLQYSHHSNSQLHFVLTLFGHRAITHANCFLRAVATGHIHRVPIQLIAVSSPANFNSAADSTGDAVSATNAATPLAWNRFGLTQSLGALRIGDIAAKSTAQFSDAIRSEPVTIQFPNALCLNNFKAGDTFSFDNFVRLVLRRLCKLNLAYGEDPELIDSPENVSLRKQLIQRASEVDSLSEMTPVQTQRYSATQKRRHSISSFRGSIICPDLDQSWSPLLTIATVISIARKTSMGFGSVVAQ